MWTMYCSTFNNLIKARCEIMFYITLIRIHYVYINAVMNNCRQNKFSFRYVLSAKLQT